MAKPSKMQQRLSLPKNQRNPLGSKTFGIMTNQFSKNIRAAKEPDATVKEGQHVIFMSRPCVRQFQFKPDDILISIADPGDGLPSLCSEPKAIQQLNYVAYPEREDRLAGNTFDSARALAVATFLKLNTHNRIIVHCSYGEQRSFAMASAIGEYFNFPVYTVSSDMRIIDRPKHSSAPIGDYCYMLFKALDAVYEA